MTTAELAAIGIANPVSAAEQAWTGPECSWVGDSGASAGIAWPVGNTDGLADLYLKAGEMAYFQQTTVLGYPGAFGDVTGDGRPLGQCKIAVAVSDNLYFNADFAYLPGSSEACRAAEQAAADLLKNLGGFLSLCHAASRTSTRAVGLQRRWTRVDH